MIMPYGKFKGKRVDELPSYYLLWMAENWDETTERNKQLIKAADQEWQRRERYNAHILHFIFLPHEK